MALKTALPNSTYIPKIQPVVNPIWQSKPWGTTDILFTRFIRSVARIETNDTFSLFDINEQYVYWKW